MANKVVTIVVDEESDEFNQLLAFLAIAGNDKFPSVTIKDEAEDPLFPDRRVSRPWLRENWRVTTLDSHVLDKLELTPKQLQDKALAGELPHTLKHDDPTKLVLVVIEHADELRHAMTQPVAAP